MAIKTNHVSRRSDVAWMVVVAFACLMGVADACSVPVFRYALDHWLPDAFRVRILRQGPLSEDAALLVTRLKDQAAAKFSNITVEQVDLQEVDDPELHAHFEQSTDAGFPVCFVQGPTSRRDEYRDVWSGQLTSEIVDTLPGSPIRDQIARQLLAGTSVVWIYLESGDAAVDDANYELLKTTLQQLEEELELPEIDEVDLKELSTSPEDVKLKLSSVRLSRSDPQEALLVEMLLSSEPDLRDAMFINEPMAFPVFGRGRVLYSLVGKGITAGLIEDACRFLTGACQCTVKDQNPGVDLLLSVDWDGLISPTQPADVEVTLTGLAGFQSDAGQEPTRDVAVADVETKPAAAQATSGAPATAKAKPESPDITIPPTPSESAPEEEVDESAEGTIVVRPENASTGIRPGLLIAVLGLLVVVGSFFLIPRH